MDDEQEEEEYMHAILREESCCYCLGRVATPSSGCIFVGQGISSQLYLYVHFPVKFSVVALWNVL